MSELVGHLVHRRLAQPLVRAFVSTRAEPVLATIGGLAACLVAAALFGLNRPAATISAGVMVMVAATLDCVDGGAAAATGRVTPWRSWLDTIADRVGDAAIVIGITVGASQVSPSTVTWVIGASAAVSMGLSSYARKEYELRFGASYPHTLVDRLARRDVRTLGIFVGSLLLHPFWAVVVLGAISLMAVFSGLVRCLRSRPAE